MKMLFASAEIYPYAKTGGLADVAQALPKALSKKIDVLSIMPLYDFIDRDTFEIHSLDESFLITLGAKIYTVSLYRGFNHGVETLFVYEPMLCSRKSPYGDRHGDYPNNDLRFGLFSKAIVITAQMYAVDILHLNDWHTALTALWAKEIAPDIGILFTIHNLAFQGLFSMNSMRKLGLESTYFNPESIEYWGQINCMKAGIAYSDTVTTVSPRYAEEILKPQFGCGLDGFLRVHRQKLYGILNGIDTVLFDPEHDPFLIQNYTEESIVGKEKNKQHLCQKYHFRERHRPLFIFIGRFTEQKGLDIIIQALPELLKIELNFAIIGEGDATVGSVLKDTAKKHQNFSVFFGYKESLSHQMYAAADFLLMPSSFEPCGLNQLISLRYGTIPVVHRVGGIYNTIQDVESEGTAICGQGIAMRTFDENGLIEAVERAVILFESPNALEAAKSNMHCDVSFEKSAALYRKRYMDII